MKNIVLITFKIETFQQSFKIASKNEPNKTQIIEKLQTIVDNYELTGQIKHQKFLQEKDNKLYLFSVGELGVLVNVERLEVFEFEK